MKRTRSTMLALLAIGLIAMAAFPLAQSRRSNDMPPKLTAEASERPAKRVKTPPEDSFLTQRVVHGGIPTGAMERARAQVTRARTAALRAAPGQLAAEVASATWQFVGPTNIGGRIVDVAVDP